MRVIFFSSGYWDVSLCQVVLITLWIQVMIFRSSTRIGFPIWKSPDKRLLATSPRLFAGCYVLHRLLMSRHPPFALKFLFNHKNWTANDCSRIILVKMLDTYIYFSMSCPIPIYEWMRMIRIIICRFECIRRLASRQLKKPLIPKRPG